MAEFWLQLTDGVAHELWEGPFPSKDAAAAEAKRRGWWCAEGITAVLVEKRPGEPDRCLKIRPIVIWDDE